MPSKYILVCAYRLSVFRRFIWLTNSHQQLKRCPRVQEEEALSPVECLVDLPLCLGRFQHPRWFVYSENAVLSAVGSTSDLEFMVKQSSSVFIFISFIFFSHCCYIIDVYWALLIEFLISGFWKTINFRLTIWRHMEPSAQATIYTGFVLWSELRYVCTIFVKLCRISRPSRWSCEYRFPQTCDQRPMKGRQSQGLIIKVDANLSLGGHFVWLFVPPPNFWCCCFVVMLIRRSQIQDGGKLTDSPRKYGKYESFSTFNGDQARGDSSSVSKGSENLIFIGHDYWSQSLKSFWKWNTAPLALWSVEFNSFLAFCI